jgi:glycosyltransferase involved in cell wall biosynthesis
MNGRRPRILCLSFSDIRSDSRVLRQIEVLRRRGDVTTLGYGAAPDGVAQHLAIPRSLPSLPQTVPGVLQLALRRYASVEVDAPAVRAALRALDGREFDIVVANEARALPLAFRVAGSPAVWCDLHEWAPQERVHVLSWRILIAPFMSWICGRYLPRTDAATTINDSIAALYREQYGVEVEIVRNAIPFRPELAPTPVPPDRIRLVHSGGAVPGRNIEAIIDAVDELGAPYELDLYLLKAREGDSYWQSLTNRIAASDRVTLHDPVAPDRLPAVLNEFDLGVFLLPPHTPNHRMMLPNKFFDFVQARIGIVFSPAVETDRLIRRHGLGLVTDGFDAASLVRALRDLRREDVERFKAAADAAARPLSSESDVAVEDAILTRLAAR